MATLGAHAPRHPLSDVDAVVALVRISRIRTAMSTQAEVLPALVLSPPERDLFAKAVTLKRKTELLGGRLAAKSVCMTLRGGDTPLESLADLDVRAEVTGAPLCVWPDGATQHVSIAHGGSFAIALGTIDDGECGVDIEPAARTLDRAIDGFFHSIERLQIGSDSDARLCWTVREAWGKLTARGVAVDLDRVATVRAAGAWWLAAPRSATRTAVVAAGANASLAIAVAMRRDGSQ